MLAQRNVDAMLAASETYKAVSWGTRYMGMDRLKAEVSEYKLDAKVNVAVIDTGVNSSDTLFEGRINEEGSMNCFARAKTGATTETTWDMEVMWRV